MVKKENTGAENKPNTNLIVLGVWVAAVAVIIGAYFLFFQTQPLPPVENPLSTEITQLNERLAKNPNDTSALMKLGQDLNKEKRFDEALGVFKTALKRDAGNTVALVSMASTKMAMGKGDEAGPLLDKALKIKPNYDFAKFMKSIYLARIKKDYPASLSLLVELRQQLKDKAKINTVDNMITQIKQQQSQAESSSTTPNNSSSK